MQRASGDPKALGAGICVVVDLGSAPAVAPSLGFFAKAAELLARSFVSRGISELYLVFSQEKSPRSKSCRAFGLLR